VIPQLPTASHPWARTSIHLNLSPAGVENTNSSSNFPIPLLADFNQTGGGGTFCVRELAMPVQVAPEIHDGLNASVQAVQVVEGGEEVLFNVGFLLLLLRRTMSCWALYYTYMRVWVAGWLQDEKLNADVYLLIPFSARISPSNPTRRPCRALIASTRLGLAARL
jgi:hypothetical protein